MSAVGIREMQRRVGVNADGIAGPVTYTALFVKMGASSERAEDLALAAAAHFEGYGLLDSTLRLAHFLAQVAHESGSFRYMEEVWGPTDAQRRYEGRKDLGNIIPGDGVRYKGRGPIQITGRRNYRYFGREIGIDIEKHPEIAAIPSIGLHLALAYWDDRGLNTYADEDDIETITRRINGGLNGYADRKAHLAKIKGWLL